MFGLGKKIISKKLIGGSFLLIFSSVLFFSLFQMSGGTDMTGESTGCPFMSHETTFCPMSVFDHLGAWEAFFLAVVPTLVMLSVVAIILFLLPPNLLLTKYNYKIPILFRDFVWRIYAYFYRRLQELFSSGILNPKLH